MVLTATKRHDVRKYLVVESSQGDLGALCQYLTDCGWVLVFSPEGECPLGGEILSAGEISDQLEPRDG